MKNNVNKFAEIVTKLHLKAYEFKQLNEILESKVNNPEKKVDMQQLLIDLEKNLQETKALKMQLYDIYKQENSIF